MSQPIRRYDICAGRPYTTRDGAEKKQWIKVGKLTEWSDGGPSIEMFAMPVGSWFDGKLSCFEQEADGAQQGGNGRSQRSQAPAPQQRPQRTAHAAPGDQNDPIPF